MRLKKSSNSIDKVEEKDLVLLKKKPKKFWKKITSISDFAFQYKNLESIEIPDSVKEIGNYAFYYSSLKSVKLPKGLKRIKYDTFDSCSKLEDVEIPEGVEVIGNGAFSHCEKLKEIILPKSLKSLGGSAFYMCSSLEKIEIPDNVEEIGELAFSCCKNLKEVKLPKSLKNIGKLAFDACSSLEKIEIPEGVEKIERSTFEKCENLKYIKLPTTLKSVEEKTFKDCSSLESIEIPEGVEEIGEEVFAYCPNLKHVKLPSTLKRIGTGAFKYCASLESIELPDGIEEISEEAFSGCEKLNRVKMPKSLKSIRKSAFYGCKSLEQIVGIEKLENINERAFEDCKNLKHIELPKSLKYVGDYAFSSCDNLGNLEFDDTVKIFGFPCGYSIMKLKIGKESVYSSFYFPTANFLFRQKSQYEQNRERMQRIIRSGILIPEELINDNNLDEYLYRYEYKFMKNLAKMMSSSQNDINYTDLFKLAKIMGVLEPDSVKVRVDGKEVPVNGVAYTILQGAIKRGDLKLDEMHMHFQSIPDDKYNKEFLSFMANKTNLHDLLEYAKEYPGFLSRVYSWYENRKSLSLNGEESREGDPTEEKNRYKIRVYETTESGIDKLKWRTPTVELFVKEFSTTYFEGITDKRSQEIASYVGRFTGYYQKHFDKAMEIDNERIASQVKDHIVDEHIKEDVIESLEDYKRRTSELKEEIVNEIGETTKHQTDTASKIFTYEMLAKSDTANFAMGFLTSCCATLYGAGAGAQRAMILHPDMQPLVIRNIKGDIVAFGIIYVNREEGYAVVNDFEVNRKYSDDEIRKEIYTKAMQGVGKFVETYNVKHKDKPINIVTCGVSPNWKAINDFICENPESPILNAPRFSDFQYNGYGTYDGDWHKEQHIIWQNDEKARNK